jgi:MFS family permease
MFLPLGITNGYVVVTLVYLLSHAEVSVAAVAAMVAWSLFPQTWKVVWGPVVDTTLSNKSWFVISAILSGLGVLATAVVPPTNANFVTIEILVVLTSVASGMNALAADALMAHATLPEEKGRAGGWSQAGNLGGTGIGGGAGLWLAQHVHPSWVSGAVLGFVCIAASAALLFVEEPAADHRAPNYLKSLTNVARDVWSVSASRAGFAVLVLMLLPIGVGSAQNLWSAVAGDWHANADTVALVNGVLGGVVSLVGCLAGGYVADLMDRKLAYNISGILIAIVAVIMALAPRTSAMFVVFTLVYAFVMGLCYATWGGVVLESIGKGAAATKYNLLASLSNIPIAYQTLIDGWAQTHYGSSGMLFADALGGVAGVAFFVALLLALGLLRARTAVPSPA